jgi:hypothetical protein
MAFAIHLIAAGGATVTSPPVDARPGYDTDTGLFSWDRPQRGLAAFWSPDDDLDVSKVNLSGSEHFSGA